MARTFKRSLLLIGLCWLLSVCLSTVPAEDRDTDSKSDSRIIEAADSATSDDSENEKDADADKSDSEDVAVREEPSETIGSDVAEAASGEPREQVEPSDTSEGDATKEKRDFAVNDSGKGQQIRILTLKSGEDAGQHLRLLLNTGVLGSVRPYSSGRKLILKQVNDDDVKRIEAFLDQLGVLEKYPPANPQSTEIQTPGTKADSHFRRPKVIALKEGSQSYAIKEGNRSYGIVALLIRNGCSNNLSLNSNGTKLIIDGADGDEIREIEKFLDQLGVLEKPLDWNVQTNPRPTSVQPTAISTAVEIPNTTETQKLISSLSTLEAKSITLAEQIRNESAKPDAAEPKIAELRRELNEALASALSLKFELENLQIKAVEERLARLKAQMQRRNTSVKQIVERRARELIEGDSSSWIPQELSSTNGSSAKKVSSLSNSPSDFERMKPGSFFDAVSESEDSPLTIDQRKIQTVESIAAPEIKAQKSEASSETLDANFKNLFRQFSEIENKIKRFEEHVKRGELNQTQDKGAEAQLFNSRRLLLEALQNRIELRKKYESILKDIPSRLSLSETDAETAREAWEKAKDEYESSRSKKTRDELENARLNYLRKDVARGYLKHLNELLAKSDHVVPHTNDPAIERQQETVKILVSKTNIEQGDRLDDSNVYFRNWPKNQVHGEYIIDAADYEGRSSAFAVPANHPILIEYLKASERGGVPNLIRKGMSMVTITPNKDQLHGGLVRPGSEVCISCVITRPAIAGQPETTTIKTVLRRAKVVAVVKGDGNKKGKTDSEDGLPESISLVVYPQQAKLLNLARAISHNRICVDLLGDEEKSDEDSHDFDDETFRSRLNEMNRSRFHDVAETQKEKGTPVFVSFDQFAVNLNEPNLTKFISLSIVFQTDAAFEERVKWELETNKVLLKSHVSGLIADKSVEDLRGKAGVDRLRREIQDLVNSILFKEQTAQITDVLFDEYHVQ